MVSCLHDSAQTQELSGKTSPDGWHQEALHAIREIKPLCDRVAVQMTVAGYCSRDIFAVRLTLEEAIVNAIKHGHLADARKTVHVQYRVNSEQVLANVEDEGSGFDPHQIPDPLSPENIDRSTGRGLMLMRHYMTWVKYNDRGNVLTLCKCRTF
jgi:serine/threonine-protein kinase RsbW